MSNKIPAELKKAYETALAYIFHLMPISQMDIDSVIAEDTMIYGTTVDENVHGIDDFKRIMKMQAKELEGLDISFDRNLISEHLSHDGETGLFIEEVKMTINMDETESVSHVRMSFVMEKIDGSWKLIHGHGSKPVESEEDPWHVKEWEAEKKRLETKVDEQTADLKSKNRSLEVEAAAERIRAKAMEMEKPDDIQQVLGLIKKEVDAFNMGNISTWLFIFEAEDKVIHWELADYHLDGDINHHYTVFNPNEYSASASIVEKWGEDFFSMHFKGKSLRDFVDSVSELDPEQTQNFREAVESGHIKEIWQVGSSFPKGILGTIFTDTPPEQARQVLVKVADAFGMAYQRFEDLQKAEQRRKEAELEAAVERVRAHAMGMQEPDDIMNVLGVIKQELEKFELENMGTWAWIFNEDDTLTQWDISEIDLNGTMANVNITIGLQSMSMKPHASHWQNKEYYSMPWEGDQLKGLIKEVKELDPENGSMFEEAVKNGRLSTYWQACAPFSRGVLGLDYAFEPPAEAERVLTKMASAFDMAYRRFEDLQKAEQRRKAAELEASVERVRAHAMGMQEPDDLMRVLELVMEEVNSFDLGNMSAFIWAQEKDGTYTQWDISQIEHLNDETVNLNANFNVNNYEQVTRHAKAWQEESDYYTLCWRDEELQILINEMTDIYPEGGDIFQGAVDSGQIVEYWNAASIYSEGILGLGFNFEPPKETEQILNKLASAFDMAYRRFEDLQEAERRARESRIESALERIRSQSLAMQTSDELRNVADVLYEQMRKLDQPLLEGSAIHFYEKHDDEIEAWYNMPSNKKTGKHVSGRAFFPKNSCWVTKEWLRKYEEEENEYEVFTSKKQQKEWLEVLKSHAPSVGSKVIEGEPHPTHMHFVDFSGGAMIVVSRDPISDDTKSLQKRAAAVFDLAYRRFEDLKLAEFQAYESKVEASLERVRGMAAAMNHSDDLKQIAEAMFKEMEILKINPLRYGLGIIDREAKAAELWASTVNDGHYLDLLGTLSLTWHPMLRQVFDAWEAQHEEVIYELKGKELNDYYRRVGKVNPEIPDLDRLQNPETDIVHYVSFFPFKTGTLYAFTDGEPDEDGKSILKRFANVFEQAHIRYGDLQTTEMQARQIMEERDRLAETLKELRSTQEQLVQQEKLASLGQLTAGIAHEIKNPLNFVNNFSDVSIELVEEAREECQRVADEMRQMKAAKEESNTGEEKDESSSSETEENSVAGVPDPDPDLILEILGDIDFNLRKINDHGTRADSIVKSMLQHSRGGSGQMEPTKINTLIKEYTNLAFHGMRAGKNAFNLDLDLDLETDLGDVNLIAEDFSRVILNLCNNAFDAMRDKLNTPNENSGDYLPKLSVRTKRNGTSVIIDVEDNGPGIPDEMKDKIMQPFFTTKKGTAGTGLGLSITNDIIKAHGGTLTVKSSAEEGSVFTIKLIA